MIHFPPWYSWNIFSPWYISRHDIAETFPAMIHFPPWYSWNIDHLALNNNTFLTLRYERHEHVCNRGMEVNINMREKKRSLSFFLLPIVLSVLFRLTASDYPLTKFRLFYSITINRNFPLYKLFKLDANIIIISFNVFLISLYYKNKANNKMPLPTCDKWHKG
jgi:hypothetical protein